MNMKKWLVASTQEPQPTYAMTLPPKIKPRENFANRRFVDTILTPYDNKDGGRRYSYPVQDLNMNDIISRLNKFVGDKEEVQEEEVDRSYIDNQNGGHVNISKLKRQNGVKALKHNTRPEVLHIPKFRSYSTNSVASPDQAKENDTVSWRVVHSTSPDDDLLPHQYDRSKRHHSYPLDDVTDNGLDTSLPFIPDEYLQQSANRRTPTPLPSISEDDESLSNVDSGVEEIFGNEEPEIELYATRSHSPPIPSSSATTYRSGFSSNPETLSTKQKPDALVTRFLTALKQNSPSNDELNSSTTSVNTQETVTDSSFKGKGDSSLQLENMSKSDSHLNSIQLNDTFDTQEISSSTENSDDGTCDTTEFQESRDSPLVPNIPQPTLVHPLESSMLWKGITSTRPPSSIEVYNTLPPSQYPKRNKDFTSQLFNYKEESKGSLPRPREFRVNLDVSHYSPEEIHVVLEDGKLVVSGKHFSDSEYGYESCQFYRRYPIPDGITKSDITSKITEEGVLTIIGKQKQDHDVRVLRGSKYNINEEEDFSHLHNEMRSKSVVSVGDSDFQEVDDRRYLLKVDCQGYSPDDITVKIIGRELVIKGETKVRISDSGQERVRQKQFTRRYSLPRYADIDSVTSKMTESDVLKVEVKKLHAIKSREMNVHMSLD